MPGEEDNNVTNSQRVRSPRRSELKRFYTIDTGQKKDGRRMSFQRPKGTIEYSVESRDTLNSIALKFDTTPNELVQLNKLFSRSVVPGQALYVPDPEYTSSVESSPSLSPISPLSPTSSEADLEKATTDSDGGPRKEATPSPAHILHRAARVVSSTSEEEEALTEKFLKINCKYITEGKGAVSGVLLVTPNNIMFDPHKADPLVQARGCEEYGIMCPLEEVVSAAMYKEITDSKVRESVPVNMEHLFLGFDPCRQQRTAGDPGNDSTSTAPRSTEGSLSEEVFTESELSPVREELWQKSSCPSSESVQTISLADPTGAATHNAGPGRGTSREASDPTESQPTGHLPPEGPGEDASNKRSVYDREGAKSRSASESQGSDALATDASGQGGPGNGALAPDAETRVREPSPTGQSHTKLQAKEPKEDIPETHSGAAAGGPKQEVERRGSKQGLAAASREKRRHRSHKFLCLRVGKPMKKTFVSHASATMQQYAQRDRKHEYWFAVPQERSDHLYVFFIQWSPDVYGEGSSGQGREPGFTVVKKNEQSETGEDERPTTDITAKEWEISTKEEVNSKHVSSIKTDPELEPFKPNLTVPSDLLQAEHIEKLAKHLPPRTIGYPWTLAFSTSRNGMSMKTLYRTMQAQDSPVLMVVRDADGQLFGALASEPLKVSDGFYGTGETFLFTFCPDFEVFKWTGDNMFFIKGDMDSLAFGGGGGEFGLWLDGDLYHGRSHSCKTFGNPILTKKEDFVVQDIEIWSFE